MQITQIFFELEFYFGNKALS